MVLPVIMMTGNNFKQEKMLKFTKFCNFEEVLGKISILKIAAQAFVAGEFLNIFLRF